MPASHRFAFSTGGQLFHGVVADRFQKAIAHRVATWFNLHQRRVDQSRRRLQHRARFVTPAHRRLQRPAAGKHSQPPQQCMLVVAEQVITPVK